MWQFEVNLSGFFVRISPLVYPKDTRTHLPAFKALYTDVSLPFKGIYYLKYDFYSKIHFFRRTKHNFYFFLQRMTMGVFPISWAAPAGLDHVFRRQFFELLLLWIHLVILVF